MLFLNATYTHRILEVFKSFIGVNINSVRWPEPKEMTNQKVRFNLQYTTQWFSFILNCINPYVTPHLYLPNKLIIYSNQQTKINIRADKLEELFNDDWDLCSCGIVTRVGILTEE